MTPDRLPTADPPSTPGTPAGEPFVPGPLRRRLEDAEAFRAARGRPFVLLTYAQSLDGCIAGPRRERVRLSGPEAMRLTHGLRGRCETIVVGIGTVLADDPRLTVKPPGTSGPRPIVLDTHLRTPRGARLLQRSDVRPLLVHGPQVPDRRRRELEAAGAEPLPCPLGPDGRIDAAVLLERLARAAVNSVMVEGGARVITHFLQHRLADFLVITIAPRFLGGLPALEDAPDSGGLPIDFSSFGFERLGADVVFWAEPPWTGR